MLSLTKDACVSTTQSMLVLSPSSASIATTTTCGFYSRSRRKSTKSNPNGSSTTRQMPGTKRKSKTSPTKPNERSVSSRNPVLSLAHTQKFGKPIMNTSSCMSWKATNSSICKLKWMAWSGLTFKVTLKSDFALNLAQRCGQIQCS